MAALVSLSVMQATFFLVDVHVFVEVYEMYLEAFRCTLQFLQLERGGTA